MNAIGRRLHTVALKMEQLIPHVEFRTTSVYVSIRGSRGRIMLYPTATGSLVLRISKGNTVAIAEARRQFAYRNNSNESNQYWSWYNLEDELESYYSIARIASAK